MRISDWSSDVCSSDLDWIKRVIGLPGDTIEYKDNQVFVNGQPFAYERVGAYVGVGSGAELHGARLLTEQIAGQEHQNLAHSSEEARVGHEWIDTSRHRWETHSKNNKNKT